MKGGGGGGGRPCDGCSSGLSASSSSRSDHQNTCDLCGVTLTSDEAKPHHDYRPLIFREFLCLVCRRGTSGK